MAIGPVGPIVGDAPVGSTGHAPSQAPFPEGAGSHGAALPGGAAPALSPGATGPAMPPASPLQAALDAVIARALARQDGLAPVLAAAAQLGQWPPGVVPPAVKAALDALGALVVRDGGPQTTALVATLAASGLPAGGRPGDLGAVLAALVAALDRWVGARRPESQPRPVGERPEPPRRSAPPVAEPALPLAPPRDAPKAIAARLLDGAERAIDRLVLHQAAAVPDAAADPAAPPDRQEVISFPVPVAGPTGLSVASVRIERDPPDPDSEAPGGRALRVDIALDVDPLGPLHARLALVGADRVAVGLWCDRPEAVAVLEAGLPSLRAGLAAAGLDLADASVHAGPPPEARPPLTAPAHHRLDVSL